MKKRKSFLLFLLLFILLAGSHSPVQAAEEIRVQRIAGRDRYLTSLQINQEFKEAKRIILANGQNFPDALVGSTLASHLDAPLYISPANRLPFYLEGELRRLRVEEIILLGGPASISTAIEDQLRENYQVTRLAGSDRYKTAEAINDYIHEYFLVANHFYVSGLNFPDALAAGPMVANNNGVMHLVQPDEWISSGIAIGGPNSVAGDIRRLAGVDRYETAVEIAKAYVEPVDTVILVSGQNFPDALASAGLVQNRQAAILLTAPDHLSQVTKEFMMEREIEEVIIVGGYFSLSSQIEADLREIGLY